ncbi:hypothetical protein ebA5530 [Aromatoleum aromaticum EbN1]|uniref:Uncharacterized protein n=1 Tax=Aromatoleum aromaticum (strain DSM 19018 / LMG 30748 / EbN1) TaxID=76114 RepID=Q5P093_AROAE|nr:hypothetical protein ebA5530 [Aromatoleum aromaticum EbN1]
MTELSPRERDNASHIGRIDTSPFFYCISSTWIPHSRAIIP